jgi:glycosyltransferase involved in cell wall biosynthesis
VSVSIIILAQDEEHDLPRLLESIRWCDDVHVVDSGSTDSTLNIARGAGVHCHQHPFASFAAQRNWAIENCGVRHPWILFLDADEASTEAFQRAVLAAINTAADSTAGFYCCWKMIVEDRWLKHCDSFPKWQFRLLRRGRADFVDFGHGQKEGRIDGVLGYIRAPYLHFALSKGWTDWLERHNRYATEEAAVRLQTPVRWKEIFAKDPSIRNKAIKPLVSRLPGWPLLRFFHAYFLSFGFLEGAPGFIYCVNLAYYEFLIQIKQREIRRKQSPHARHRLGN